ncbi:hypothetical protein V8G54_004236 [Vigna mungo]|uniref:Uncharacterized protein n=1 Tax=Vigna mungo TaxID=3915 RepID=A0AAQ3PDG1_VIGMU
MTSRSVTDRTVESCKSGRIKHKFNFSSLVFQGLQSGVVEHQFLQLLAKTHVQVLQFMAKGILYCNVFQVVTLTQPQPFKIAAARQQKPEMNLRFQIHSKEVHCCECVETMVI